ncbi:g394 [Coccomyxa elongata]
MSRTLAVATLLALSCATLTNGQISLPGISSGGQDILQTIMDGLSSATPNVEKVATGLMDKYQQTLQDLLSTFTNTVNTAGELKSKANDQITSTTAQVVGSTESTIKAALDAANQVYAKVTDSSKPVIGQVANGAQYIAQSAQDAVSQVKDLYATYEDAYCTPAEYIPPAKVPANLTGPGFTLTFALGNCTFDDKQLLSKDGAIECVGPSVTLDKTPATFTSAYVSAAKFVGQQCEISKSFGDTEAEILYVFDPKELATQPAPLKEIADYLEQQLTDILSTIGIQPVMPPPTATTGIPVAASPTALPPVTTVPLVVSPVPAASPPATVITVPSSPDVTAASPPAVSVKTVPATDPAAATATPPGMEAITVPTGKDTSAAAAPPGVTVITVPASGGR